MTRFAQPTPHARAARWDGQALLTAMTMAADCLFDHQPQIDALNVFPVPDGDTGANMVATMRSAIAEAERLSPGDRGNAGLVAKGIAAGSLIGARGNSGVILSQIFRGFAVALADRADIGGYDIACALDRASEMAYRAVMEPVEGTMLTVIRVAAEYAKRVTDNNPSIAETTSESLRGAEVTLAQTTEMLDKLRDAGVVDAGGQGVVCILSGLDRFARGDRLPVESRPLVRASPIDIEFAGRSDEIHGEGAFGYCTNFMVLGEAIPFDRVRLEMAAMGNSAVIVGDDAVVKVHIHTEHPGQILDYAIQFGELEQIKIDNMNHQVRSLNSRRTGQHPRPAVNALDQALGQIAILAVSTGAGLAEAQRSLGATVIVDGGDSMNPTTAQLLDAVEAMPADEVIVLPNDPTALLAAKPLAELTHKRVRVVPSRSVPQGIAALEAFNDELSLDDNARMMSEAVQTVRTVQVARADNGRTATDIDVAEGEFVGLLDDEIVAAGPDADRVLVEAIRHGDGAHAELISVFIGDGGPSANESSVGSQLSAMFEDAEVQVYDGGQPHDRYIAAIE